MTWDAGRKPIIAPPDRGGVLPAIPGQPWAAQAGGRLVRPAGTSRVIAQRAHRVRAQRRPWIALAFLIAASSAAHAYAPARPGWWLALLAAGLAAPVLARRHAGDRVRAAYAVTCLAAGGSWAAVVVRFGLASGPGRWMLLALVVPGLFPLAWLWWQHHRVRPGSRGQPAGPDEVMLAYHRYFAAPGRPGDGTWLSGPDPIRGAKVYAIHLDPGRHTPEEIIQKLPKLSSALAPLGLTRERLVLEPMPGPSIDEPGPDHMARLTVLEQRAPQREIQEFTGPTLDPATGLFDDGPYPDGQMAQARLYKTDEHGQPIRTASSLIVGAQGSGKSRFVEHKVLEHMQSGLFAVWLIDGMGGSSMPGLIDHVDWAAIHPSEWIKVLTAAARLRVYRSRVQAARRLGHWPASTAEPFIHIPIDEAQRVLQIPACVRLVKILLQEAEKTGIGLDLVTHVPLMQELGDASGTAGSHVIRALAKDGNIAVFRTGDEWTKTITIGSWAADPRGLPAGVPGMHYLAAVSLRQAPIRAIRAADPDAWARRSPGLRLSAEEARACDGDSGDYTGRRERFAEHDRAELDIGDINAQVQAMINPAQATAGESGAPDKPGGATAMSLCLQAVRAHGQIKRKDLIGELKAAGHSFSESSINQALAALKRAGAITNDRGDHGVWRATGDTSGHATVTSLRLPDPGPDDEGDGQ